MLVDRLRTSVILVAIIGVLLYLDAAYSVPGAEGLWLLPLLLFFAGGTAWDLCGLLGGDGSEVAGSGVARRPVMVGTLAVSMSAGLPILWPLAGGVYPVDCPVGRLGWIVLAGIAAVFLLLICEMRRYQMRVDPDPLQVDPLQVGVDQEVTGQSGGGASAGAAQSPLAVVSRIARGSFVVVYVGLPMALLVATRSLGGGNWGLAALMTLIAVTKSADAGAYFAGKAMGRHKLVPRLSPKKTWEGLAGGVVTATLVAYGCLLWLFPAVGGGAKPPGLEPSLSLLAEPIWGALLLGPLLTISGLVGDLAESLVKRDAGAKDSGSLLPGLGGVWDVTDSLIAVSVPAYLAFTAGVGW